MGRIKTLINHCFCYVWCSLNIPLTVHLHIFPSDILDAYALNPCTDIEQECTLEFSNRDTPEDGGNEESDCNSELSEHEDDNIEDKGITAEYKRKAVAFRKSIQTKKKKNGRKKRSFRTVQTFFKKLKSLHQLNR